MTAPTIPRDLGTRGRRLWRAIAGTDPTAVETGDPRREIALEACRAGDQLDALAGILAKDGLTVTDAKGDTRIHPAMLETNRIRPLQARLIVALRLPDPPTGIKPGARTIQGPRQPFKASAGMNALDRARGSVAS